MNEVDERMAELERKCKTWHETARQHAGSLVRCVSRTTAQVSRLKKKIKEQAEELHADHLEAVKNTREACVAAIVKMDAVGPHAEHIVRKDAITAIETMGKGRK